MSEQRLAEVGSHVVYHDSHGKPSNALVTVVWSPTYLNIVLVSKDNTKSDQYGRQIERETSCSHKSIVNVHGNYWRFVDEEPNPRMSPVEK